MFSRCSAFKLQSITQVLAKPAGQIQSHQYKSCPKVAEKTVWINVIDMEGLKHVIAGYEGESLMKTIKKHKVYLPASCQGGDLFAPETEKLADNMRYGAVCSECQVVIFEPWINYIKDMGYTEHERIVRNVSFNSPSSRLSCCIALEKWMNGMELSIPFSQEQILPNNSEPFPVGVNRIFRE